MLTRSDARSCTQELGGYSLSDSAEALQLDDLVHVSSLDEP